MGKCQKGRQKGHFEVIQNVTMLQILYYKRKDMGGKLLFSR